MSRSLISLLAGAAVTFTAGVSSAQNKTPSEDAAPPARAGVKVLALPYQSIFRTVPQDKLDAATGLLHKELGAGGAVEIIRGAVANEGKTEAVTTEAAAAKVREANEAEAKKLIAKTIKLRKQAIEAFEANAAAVADAQPYLLAHHQYAYALKLAGRDKEAKQQLDVAARMSPSFELNRSKFDRIYRKWFRAAADKVVREKRGKLLVKAALPGAAVTIDGREMDVAPVLLEKIVPGKHLVRAEIDGVPPFGKIVTIAAGKKSDLLAAFSNTAGGSSVGLVTDAISQNKIPKNAVAGAAKAGQAVGAKFVVLGAMVRNKNDDKFRVHTFVVSVANKQVKPLKMISFDLDFLTAESDVLRIAQAAQGAIESFKGGESAIARVDSRVRGSSTVNRVSASPEIARRRKATRKGKAKGRRPVFRPLKAGTIVIKDEEEE